MAVWCTIIEKWQADNTIVKKNSAHYILDTRVDVSSGELLESQRNRRERTRGIGMNNSPTSKEAVILKLLGE
jgi:hypothetical protein